MEEMQVLKPCPFCRGKAFVAWEDYSFYGRCFECGATGKKHFYVHKDEMQRAYEEAAVAWNRRDRDAKGISSL